MRVGEGLTNFCAMNITFNARSVSLGVKKGMFERVVVPKANYGTEKWGFRIDGRHKLYVMEMK